ncbi:MAG: xanthine dehydrogenase family protein molybdopterin-binding subunit [Pseudomonadota bacterium]
MSDAVSASDIDNSLKYGTQSKNADEVKDRRSDLLVRGAALFTADQTPADALHIAFVRSPVASGLLNGVNTIAAQSMPGVRCVLTADELYGGDGGKIGHLPVNEIIPFTAQPAPWAILASGTLDAVGQAVAAVVADTPLQAQDAAEIIELDFDVCERGSQAVAAQTWQSGDTAAHFAKAAHIVSCEVQHARLAPSPMETRAITVRYNDGGTLTIWHATQTPHRTRSHLARMLEIDPASLHVVAQNVGGAFGMKASLYPEEVLVVWAALKLRRSMCWSASRTEDFLSATHGRGLRSKARLAVDTDGGFLALEAQIEAPVGRWLPNSGLIPAWNGGRILPGPYEIEAVNIQTQAIAYNLAPVGIYRGAGRPEANFLMEGLVQKAAAATGLSGLEVRARNLVPAASMPKSTPTGNLLDSGDYQELLRRLEHDGCYSERLAKRDAARARGVLRGVGASIYLEPSGDGWETAQVTLNCDGTAHVASGSSGQGQARETAYAQIAASALGLPLHAVNVVCGDTETAPAGIGALASRGTAIGGSAVLAACTEAIKRRNGGEALPLTVDMRYDNKGQAWGCGAYLVDVQVDAETGEIEILDAFNLDDAGRIVNPAFALGQIQGGFAQGLGEALLERIVYDENGQLLTGSFMDYAMPRADNIPPLTVQKMETPSPMNALGAKGIGEAGTIGAPPAIYSAVLDALAPLGVRDLQMPMTPARVWQAIQDAKKDANNEI